MMQHLTLLCYVHGNSSATYSFSPGVDVSTAPDISHHGELSVLKKTYRRASSQNDAHDGSSWLQLNTHFTLQCGHASQW